MAPIMDEHVYHVGIDTPIHPATGSTLAPARAAVRARVLPELAGLAP